jgi:hypothetical protein
MAIKLGSTDINSVNLGSVGLNRIYSGLDIVFGGVAPYVPFLENLSVSPEFAWSVWQPHSSVTNCVRLRRSSDYAELDFGYVNGYVDVDSIASWGGVDTLYVVTFYSYLTNATELAIDRQAIWINSGGVNNLAAIDKYPLSIAATQTYQLSSNIITIVDYTLFLVENKQGLVGSNTNYLFSTTLRARGYLYNTSSSVMATRPNNALSLGAFPDGENVAELNRKDGIVSYYLNAVFDSNGSNADNTSIRYLFGLTSSTSYPQSELIFFKSSLGASDRSQYYTDYNSRYNKTI